MVNSCCANGCSNDYNPQKAISFFSFPFKRPDILECWIKAINRQNNWRPSKFSRLCSKHFQLSDFQDRPGSIRKVLKLDAVPSIFNLSKHSQIQDIEQIDREIPEEPYNPVPLEIQIIQAEEKPEIVITSTSRSNLKKFADSSIQCTIIQPNKGSNKKLSRQVKTLKQKLRRREMTISVLKSVIYELTNNGENNKNVEHIQIDS